MTKNESFKIAMAEYYKAERNRAQRCLDDVLSIMTNDIMDSTEHSLNRLMQYYSHTDDVAVIGCRNIEHGHCCGNPAACSGPGRAAL